MRLPLKDINAAREVFRRAIDLNPNYAEAYSGLGWTYINNDAYVGLFLYKEDVADAKSALEAFQRAIELKSEYRDAHLGAGAAYYRLRQFNEAIEAFNHADDLTRQTPEVMPV